MTQNASPETAHSYSNAPSGLNGLYSRSSSFALFAVHYGGPTNVT